MKALTIQQPWASLIALGVKTIETRGWSTTYRGPLAIHAGKKRPPSWWSNYGDASKSADPLLVSMFDEYRFDHLFDSWESSDGNGDWKHEWRGPLGEVVATCDLVDVVPMRDTGVDPGDHRRWLKVYDEQPPWESKSRRVAWLQQDATGSNVTDQLPYGDFAPGRFAWLLDNVVSCAIPAKGRQGLWNWEAA